MTALRSMVRPERAESLGYNLAQLYQGHFTGFLAVSGIAGVVLRWQNA